MNPSRWAISFVFVLTACGGSSDGIPLAPSGFTAEPLSGGAHLTWMDNSSNETEFMIERKVAGGSYAALTSVPFNTTAYHDATVQAGTSYTFHVLAMNGAVLSTASNEATMTATAGTTPDDMSSAGSATCHQAGCRAFSSYCSTDACTCVALIADHADPACTGTMVTCTADPCMGKTASCNHGTGMCVVQ